MLLVEHSPMRLDSRRFALLAGSPIRFTSLPSQKGLIFLETDMRKLSTWYFNGIALSAILLTSLIVCICLAFSGSELSTTVLICFVVMSFLGASWANVGLGPKIGWDRGGLPVVLVVISAATVFYSLCALVIGGCIYICVGLGMDPH